MSKNLTQEQLIAIADEFGTPVYIYHAERIAEQYKKLKKAFSNCNARFFYACKSLTNLNVLKYIQSIGASLDCVSINEVKLGLLAGFDKKDILYTPNCVDFEEVVEVKGLGVNINIDNISILEQFGHKFGNSYPVCIRLNPHIMAGGNYKISTGHIDSKFGISIHQMRHIERIVKSTNLNVTGIHMHTGSEIKDVRVFLEGLDVMFSIAAHFPNLEFIDLGSGFKVPYQPGDAETDINDLGKKVTQAFIDLIRPMMYDAYHHIENISNTTGPERIYNVVGNICETDTFAWDRKLTEVREGDYLVFYNAGAYGFEMASNFNSRLKPAEVMVVEGKAKLVRQRDVFEDLLRNQIL